MKRLIRGLRVFGYLWIVLATLLILGGFIGIWLQEGVSGLQKIFSPFNLLNIVITVGPGFGFLILSDRLRKQMEERDQ